MDYNTFINRIEKLYLDNNYQSIIDLWRKNSNKYKFDGSNELDYKLLETVKESCFELKLFALSLSLTIMQLKSLTKLNISLNKKEELLKYCFSDMLTSLLEMNKLLSYYRMKRQYLLIWDNKEYKSNLSDIEKVYYKKFLKFNNYLMYILILLVIIFFSASIFNYQVNSIVKILFDLFTWAGVVYVLIMKIFSRKIPVWFVELFRRLYTPESKFKLNYLKAIIWKV